MLGSMWSPLFFTEVDRGTGEFVGPTKREFPSNGFYFLCDVEEVIGSE